MTRINADAVHTGTQTDIAVTDIQEQKNSNFGE
jgi:hypothetical protein